MPRLIWSQPALRNVQRLYRFLASQNPLAAQRPAKAIRQGMKVLGQQPRLGRPIEDMPDEFREWTIDFGGAAIWLATPSTPTLSRSSRCGT
jgi:plasmid stabilization system protein ParE